MKTKFKRISFFYWDDGNRTTLIALDPRWGWEFQQQGKFLFLGIFYLVWCYC